MMAMESKRRPCDGGAVSLGLVHAARQFEDHVLELESARKSGWSLLTEAVVLQVPRRC